VELYELRLVPKAVHKSEAHAHGTTETVLVLTGSLRLGLGAATYDLGSGDSVFFRADVAHFYENLNTRETRFLNVIHYVRE
jgi:quercetin dioxygenase-like cupin family protein